MNRNVEATGRSFEDIEADYLRYVSLRCKVQVPEFADMVEFLTSPAGAKITGEDLLGVFLSESGVRATARNVLGYGGLNGMGEKERQALGFTGGIEAWTRLAPEEQLTYIRRFIDANIRSFAGGDYGALSGPGRLYLLNFTPAHIRKSDSFVIFPRGTSGYNANAGIDVNKDGVIDVADVSRFLSKNVLASKAYFNELRGRLASATHLATPNVAGLLASDS